MSLKFVLYIRLFESETFNGRLVKWKLVFTVLPFLRKIEYLEQMELPRPQADYQLLGRPRWSLFAITESRSMFRIRTITLEVSASPANHKLLF